MTDQPSSSELVDRVRRRLVDISDELRNLASDDFAAKHKLNVEADALRVQLDELTEDSSATLRGWADRAGRKGAHSVNDVAEAAKSAIVSPSEGGGLNWPG